MQQEFIYELKDIEFVAQQLLTIGKDYSIWSFSGQMGAGKTSLIKAICTLLHVQENVSSPTYALVNEYAGERDGQKLRIYHSDWYRISSAEEARAAGIEDLLDEKDSIHFIEWSSNAAELLQRAHLLIEIQVIDVHLRKICLKIF